MTDAHQQHEAHTYWMHYPAHGPRPTDPHYKDFDAYHAAHRATARCFVGERIGLDECKTTKGTPAVVDPGGVQLGLELHHTHIEFAVQNAVDLAALEHDYPGLSDPDSVGAWVESGTNLRWLCAYHHRGASGAHTATHSDWEAAQYIRGLIS